MEFTEMAKTDAIINCVSVVDGLHVKIIAPTKTGNVSAYYSGHHHCYGLNVQAACDSTCQFTYMAVAAVGSANDRVAIQRTNFYELMNKMPEGYVVIGDAAYEPTERLIPLYYGAKRNNPLYDNFNYYGSRLRQCIERAFGIMVRKWGILHKPIMSFLPNVPNLIMAIACLHNFCIRERIARGLAPETTPETLDDVSLQPVSIPAAVFLPSVCMENNERGDGDPIETNVDEPGIYKFPGYSHTRHLMVFRVLDKKLTRLP